MSYKIGDKDGKILLELDYDSHATASRIAKKCGLPKHVVRYRMSEMERKGVIRKYYAVVDMCCLGYSNFRVYWKFMDAPPDLLEEISAYLSGIKSLWWAARVSPTYDIVCAGWTKNLDEVYSFLLDFKKKFGKNIRHEKFSFYTYMKHYPKRYLCKKAPMRDTPVPYFGRNKNVAIDAKDYKILKLLSENSRITARKISQTIKLAETSVRARIKRLESEGIIAGYKVLIDYEMIDMLYFWVHCELKNHKNIDAIEKAIAENPNVVYLDRTVGGSDLDFGVQYSSPRFLDAYLETLEKMFPDDVRGIEYLAVLKNLRLNYLPETSFSTKP